MEVKEEFKEIGNEVDFILVFLFFKVKMDMYKMLEIKFYF